MTKRQNEWYLENREEILEKRRQSYRQNKEKLDKIAYERYHSMSNELKLLRRAKDRARENGLDFDLTVEDIIIPDLCPILHTKLKSGVGKSTPNSPSLDRVHNHLGYVKGNVRVISNMANRIKADLTPELCRKLLKYWDEKE